MADVGEPRSWRPIALDEVSSSAYLRLVAMRDEEVEAAKVMADPDSYADLFLEAPSQKFFEHVGDPDENASKRLVRANRMAFVDRIRAAAGASRYVDFFVDSPHNGPPWHERFGDRGPRPRGLDEEFIDDISARIDILRQMKVIEAYMQMRGG